jgi:hypothetical protein
MCEGPFTQGAKEHCHGCDSHSWANSQSTPPQRSGNRSEALAYIPKAGEENERKTGFSSHQNTIKIHKQLLCDPTLESEL